MKFGIREIIVFALLLGFLVGSYMLGFRRLRDQQAHYRGDIRAKQQMLTTLSASAATVANLEAQLAELRESVAIFERKLPKQKEVDQILGDVWELGKRHALRARSVRPLRVDRAGVCSEQPIELTFEGSFPRFFEFVRELEASDRIVRITEINLSKIGDQKKPMQAKLTLNIYFEPDALTASAR